MRKISRRLSVALGAFIVLGIALSAPKADARPQYLKQFVAKYPKLAAAAKTKKCTMCHDPTDKKKKTRLDYGKAVGKGLTKKNEKNVGAIDKAIGTAEAAKSAKTGKTFGEMIKEGKLPE